jgi:hypothetical protein
LIQLFFFENLNKKLNLSTRQLFHLWFYVITVYILPFLLIFLSNYILLHAFLTSRKRIMKYSSHRSSFIASSDSRHRSNALTLTLFGLVGIFFICHLPAATMRILFTCYPEFEFKYNQTLSLVFTFISNFFIVFNSSINFVLYIVLGPHKFRQEFYLIIYSLRNCLCIFYHKIKCSRKRPIGGGRQFSTIPPSPSPSLPI